MIDRDGYPFRKDRTGGWQDLKGNVQMKTVAVSGFNDAWGFDQQQNLRRWQDAIRKKE